MSLVKYKYSMFHPVYVCKTDRWRCRCTRITLTTTSTRHFAKLLSLPLYWCFTVRSTQSPPYTTALPHYVLPLDTHTHPSHHSKRHHHSPRKLCCGECARTTFYGLILGRIAAVHGRIAICVPATRFSREAESKYCASSSASDRRPREIRVLMDVLSLIYRLIYDDV